MSRRAYTRKSFWYICYSNSLARDVWFWRETCIVVSLHFWLYWRTKCTLSQNNIYNTSKTNTRIWTRIITTVTIGKMSKKDAYPLKLSLFPSFLITPKAKAFSSTVLILPAIPISQTSSFMPSKLQMAVLLFSMSSKV